MSVCPKLAPLEFVYLYVFTTWFPILFMDRSCDNFEGKYSLVTQLSLCAYFNDQEHAHELLDQSLYGTLFRLLIKNSSAAHSALIDVSVSCIKSDLSKLKKREVAITTLSAPLTVLSLTEFGWHGVVEETREKCPWLTAVLDASLPATGTIRRHHFSTKRRYTTRIHFAIKGI